MCSWPPGTGPQRKGDKNMITQPVTMTGWYENNDGTVTYRYWLNGRLCDGATLRSWAELAECQAHDADDPDRAARYAD